MVLIYLTDLEGDTFFLIWENNIFMILCLMVAVDRWSCSCAQGTASSCLCISTQNESKCYL